MNFKLVAKALVPILIICNFDYAGGEPSVDSEVMHKPAKATTGNSGRHTQSRRRISRCSPCEVNGKEYKGHSRFSFESECKRYRCICYCSGSYKCPARYTMDICRGKKPGSRGSSSSTSSSSSHSSSSSSQSSSSSSASGTVISSLSSSSHSSNSSSSRANGGYANGSRIASSSAHGSSSRTTSGSAQGTSAHRTSGRRGRCRNCTVQGKEYKGHSYFEHVDGCIKYTDCTCRCNGSWVCPAERALSICAKQSNQTSTSESHSPSNHTRFESESRRLRNQSNASSGTTSSCQFCFAGGLKRKGNDYFELVEQCITYKYCVCRCNGTWNCPERFAQNTCGHNKNQNVTTSSNSVTCNVCKVKGKTYQGNRTFEIRDGCIKYSDCKCNCDGSWDCPDIGASNVCRPSKENGCQGCKVRRKSYPGNSHFSIKHECVEYRGCFCNCNGSWACHPNGTRNTCEVQSQGSGIGVEVNSTHYSTNSSKSRTSSTRNETTKNTRVQHHNNTVAVRSENTSYQATSNSSVNATCRRCRVYGRVFEGGKSFDVIDQCISFKSCICNCDGYWNCNPQFASNICKRNTTGVTNSSASSSSMHHKERHAERTNQQQCSICNAKGNVIKGNSYFNLTDGCYDFKHCLCRCDGSWDCPPQYSKNICKPDRRLDTHGPFGCLTCAAKGKIVKGGTNFNLIVGCINYRECECRCDGSWECFGNKSTNICLNNTKTSDGCLTCKSTIGTIHLANAPFSFVKDCVEYNCDCRCNGSWSCPGEKSRWACTDKCKRCDVEGRKIASNTTFTHKTGCLEYTCDCHCNGSWSCPGRTVRNTCPVDVNDNCNKCILSLTQRYEGETDFELKQGCLHYKCRCNCDGSYSCPGKDARNTCRGERIGGCRSCVVSDNQVFRGETDFSFRKDCISYQCRCKCDGSWTCPAKEARDVCLGEVPGGCRVCRVSEKDIFRPETTFELKKDCIHYKCKCNCNGGWSCPGEDARDVCKGEVPGGCRSCKISENEFYPGQSNFEMVKDCIHYKCRCYCNGGYSCPGRTAKRICRKGESSEFANRCPQCTVSDKERFEGGKPFTLKRGCNGYECKCNCDGSWVCPAAKTQNICAERITAPEVKPSRCRPCRVNRNKLIPSESNFKVNRGCYQLDCSCRCNGRWSCDTKSKTNTCQLNKRERKPTIRAKAGPAPERHVLTSAMVTIPFESETGNSFVQGDITHYTREKTSEDSNTSSNMSSKSHLNTERNIKLNRNVELTTNTKVNNNEGFHYNLNKCHDCNVYGEIKETNEVFNFDRGCVQYKTCLCLCSGDWQCAKEINNCNSGTESIRPDSRASDSISGNNVSRKTEVSSHISSNGEDGRDIVTGKDSSGRGYAVSVDTDYTGDNQHTSYSTGEDSEVATNFKKPQRYSSPSTLVNVRSSNAVPQTDQHYKQRSLSSLHLPAVVASSHHSMGSQHYNQNQQHKLSSTSDTSTTHNSGQTGSVMAHTNHKLHSGAFLSSYASKSDAHGLGLSVATSSSASSSSDSFLHPLSRSQKMTPKVTVPTGCTKCLSDGKMYIPGATFEMRRGCISYQCACLCSGSYRCKVMSDNACTESDQQRTCSNCVYYGMVFPGNMNFTVRDGCIEKNCRCNCNGTYDCPSSSNVAGCMLGSPHGTIASSSNRFRRILTGSVPIRTNYIVKSEHFYHTCSSNCGEMTTTFTDSAIAATGTEVSGGVMREPGTKRVHVARGSPGPSGAAISNGATRSRGVTGTSGTAGTRGAPGVKGAPGGRGSSAAMGAPGARSVTGVRGDPGARGAPGERGTPGARGAPGERGASGAKGSPGARGVAGARGAPGVRGGSGPRGAPRARGDSGARGTPGARGAAGARGAPGARGVAGARGAPGVRGASGPRGTVGARGAAGSRGTAGAIGARGTIGAVGTNGAQGTIGTQGARGVLGARGTAGARGAVGTRRATGTIGHNGAMGAAGATGSDGATGTAGVNAVSGTSGAHRAHVTSRDHEFNGTSEASRTGGTNGHDCMVCEVEGRRHRGNSSFAIEKGCIYFDCFCDCGGSWKCSGKVSQDCRPARSFTKRHRCRNCLVQETEYPSEAKFSLRQGCFEYQCNCNCDGSWVCPAQQPANVCSHRGTIDEFEPFSIGDGNSKFSLSHESANQQMLGRLKHGANDGDNLQCRECKLDGHIFIPGKDFQLRRGKCHLYNCYCFCNGSYVCPPENTQDLCGLQRQNDAADDSDKLSIIEDTPACRKCFMHGKDVDPLATFVNQQGCIEIVCHCQCNGKASCPEHASVNVCELEDKKAIGERPGCKVGSRTHFTRVFSMVQDCYQRVCICYDDGTWTCRESTQDKKVC